MYDLTSIITRIGAREEDHSLGEDVALSVHLSQQDLSLGNSHRIPLLVAPQDVINAWKPRDMMRLDSTPPKIALSQITVLRAIQV